MMQQKTLRLTFRITAFTLAVIFALILLASCSLFLATSFFGVVHSVSGEEVTVAIIKPTAYNWFGQLAGYGAPDAEVIDCGAHADKLSRGDVVFVQMAGWDAKFVLRLF